MFNVNTIIAHYSAYVKNKQKNNETKKRNRRSEKDSRFALFQLFAEFRIGLFVIRTKNTRFILNVKAKEKNLGNHSCGSFVG